MKIKPKDRPHYVDNAQFSNAVVEYVRSANLAEEQKKPMPVVTDYIAKCFLRIAEGLSHKANFVRYTYREEMVMDAVENCLKAIQNYNIEAATRTGKPNAFAYFTQICWYAFLRRIQKEKKQQEIKLKYLTETGLEQLVSEEIENNPAAKATQAFVDELRERISVVKETDKKVAEYKSKSKSLKKDSDISDYLIFENPK